MTDMNYVDAAFYSNKLAEMCGIKNMRNIKQPEPRLLKELGITEEGYCIFCEGYRSEKGHIQRCVGAFTLKIYNFDLVEQDGDIIIKDKILSG